MEVGEDLLVGWVLRHGYAGVEVPDQALGLLRRQVELGSPEDGRSLRQDVVVGLEPDCAYPAQLQEGGLVALEEDAAYDGVSVEEGA